MKLAKIEETVGIAIKLMYAERVGKPFSFSTTPSKPLRKGGMVCRGQFGMAISKDWFMTTFPTARRSLDWQWTHHWWMRPIEKICGACATSSQSELH